jgi:hypothetical protein
MIYQILELENIHINENETPKRTFDFDHLSPSGMKPETQESLKILSRCLVEYENENNLQMFLNPKEIGWFLGLL